MLKNIVSLMVIVQALAAQSSFGSMRPELVCKDRVLSFRVTEVRGSLFGKNGHGVGKVRVKPHQPLKIDKPVDFEIGNSISKKFSLVLFSRSDLAPFHQNTQFRIEANPSPGEDVPFHADINYFGVKSKAVCRFAE